MSSSLEVNNNPVGFLVFRETLRGDDRKVDEYDINRQRINKFARAFTRNTVAVILLYIIPPLDDATTHLHYITLMLHKDPSSPSGQMHTHNVASRLRDESRQL